MVLEPLDFALPFRSRGDNFGRRSIAFPGARCTLRLSRIQSRFDGLLENAESNEFGKLRRFPEAANLPGKYFIHHRCANSLFLRLERFFLLPSRSMPESEEKRVGC